jgi:hypothetical protein
LLPKNYNLIKAYPNPFNPSINIEIKIGSSQDLGVDVYSYDGSYISNIFNSKTIGNIQKLKWEPSKLASGIYIIRARYNGNFVYKKVTYIK